MSLARTCLRLAAVAALRGVTLAEGRVFDSRIGAIDGLMPDERKPVVAIYTEEQAGEALAPDRGPPFQPWVELVFELSMVESVQDITTGTFDIVAPQTDDELEVTLDVLEAQIRFTLFDNVAAPLSVLFRKAYRGARHYQSMRYREDQKSERIAYRYIVVKLEVPDEQVTACYDDSLDGFDLLPPTFRAIAKAWPDGLHEKSVALTLAECFKQPSLARGLVVDARVQPGDDPRTRLKMSLLRPKEKGPVPCPT